MNLAESQQGNFFPYAIRGEKTLTRAEMETYKGQQYVSYNLDNQETTVPTDVYYMPKGAAESEIVPDNYSDEIKQNKHSFYSVTVTIRRILKLRHPLRKEIRRKRTGLVSVKLKRRRFIRSKRERDWNLRLTRLNSHIPSPAIPLHRRC